jgi:hypothetical protein
MISTYRLKAISRMACVACGLIALQIDGSFNSPVALADDATDSKLKVVEVSGAGADIEGAKKDACREAVRQVVGAYVNSQTRTENDELIEDKVISLSSGFVETIETLKESQADGLTRVRIRATVRISKVLDSLKANKISVADVDGASLGAELLTKNDQRKGEAELIAAALQSPQNSMKHLRRPIAPTVTFRSIRPSANALTCHQKKQPNFCGMTSSARADSTFFPRLRRSRASMVIRRFQKNWFISTMPERQLPESCPKVFSR